MTEESEVLQENVENLKKTQEILESENDGVSRELLSVQHHRAAIVEENDQLKNVMEGIKVRGL